MYYMIKGNVSNKGIIISNIFVLCISIFYENYEKIQRKNRRNIRKATNFIFAKTKDESTSHFSISLFYFMLSCTTSHKWLFSVCEATNSCRHKRKTFSFPFFCLWFYIKQHVRTKVFYVECVMHIRMCMKQKKLQKYLMWPFLFVSY